METEAKTKITNKSMRYTDRKEKHNLKTQPKVDMVICAHNARTLRG